MFAVVIAVAAASATLAATAPCDAADVPAHVLTWYYYGLNDINTRVPPALMAHYADFVEDDALNETARLAAFKRAGGNFAVAYVNPQYLAYCFPPFSPPAGRCEGPFGRLLNGEESAFFHGRDGTRVRRFVDNHFQYQEALNPKSAAARRAWRATGDLIVHGAPTLDYFMADDAGGPLHSRDMSPRSSLFYNFNDAGTEIQSDDEFRDAWIGYLGVAPRPLFINGFDSGTGLPSYGGAFLRAPNVVGELHESCFRAPEGVATDARDHWRYVADSLLANTALHRYAVCFMMGTPTPQARTYALASWWITYDARYSIAAPIDVRPGQSAVFAEFGIVPRAPLRSARGRVAALRDGGAYVREFAVCYERRAPVGPCAAIVNPSAQPVPLPHLSLRYGHALVLDDADVFSGGRAAFTGAVPTMLAPESAAVLGR
ncbi:MAG: hypothetical protein M3169_01315 [Candidatus Eremiobacteraeota bacterium]|nr:hypothetical protein [Candidatus Eremiobacteraeota bacterium]